MRQTNLIGTFVLQRLIISVNNKLNYNLISRQTKS